ncbi:unnamed protein product, partial [Musa hybrid cultivar]
VSFLQPQGDTLEDITTVEGYTDIIVLKHFKSGVARWQLLHPVFFLIKAGMIKDSIQHREPPSPGGEERGGPLQVR